MFLTILVILYLVDFFKILYSGKLGAKATLKNAAIKQFQKPGSLDMKDSNNSASSNASINMVLTDTNANDAAQRADNDDTLPGIPEPNPENAPAENQANNAPPSSSSISSVTSFDFVGVAPPPPAVPLSALDSASGGGSASTGSWNDPSRDLAVPGGGSDLSSSSSSSSAWGNRAPQIPDQQQQQQQVQQAPNQFLSQQQQQQPQNDWRDSTSASSMTFQQQQQQQQQQVEQQQSQPQQQQMQGQGEGNAGANTQSQGQGSNTNSDSGPPAPEERIKHPMNRNIPELFVPANTGPLQIEVVKSYYRQLAKSYLSTFRNGIYRQLYFDILRRRTYALTPPGANKGIQSMLFQIIGGRVYLMDPYEVPRNSKPFYRTRINEVIWLLSKLATEGRLRNTEFLMSIHDCVQTVNQPHSYRGAHYQESNPSFTIVSCNFSNNIPFPMWEGSRNRDSGFSSWDAQMHAYAHDDVLWERKVSKAVFRGGNRPSMYFRNKSDADLHCNEVGRTRLLHLYKLEPTLLDVSIGGTCGGMRSVLDRLEPRDHHKFKYILYAEGNCMWADRTRQQLFGPSMLIKQETPCGQFFEPLLKPFTHYLPTDFFFTDTMNRIRWAKDHDDEARAIVRNANEFANNFLSLRGIEAYVEALLEEYTALLVEPDIKLETGAIDVTNKQV